MTDRGCKKSGLVYLNLLQVFLSLFSCCSSSSRGNSSSEHRDERHCGSKAEAGEEGLEAGPQQTIWLVDEANSEPGWLAVHPQVGMRYSWTGKHQLGRGRVPDCDGVFRGLPVQAAEVQVRPTPLSPQRLPFRDYMPKHPQRGPRLEA